MAGAPIVDRETWRERRRALLVRERELNRMRDALAEERRALGGVLVTTEYMFETIHGPRSLSDLFGGRSQLLVLADGLAPPPRRMDPDRSGRRLSANATWLCRLSTAFGKSRVAHPGQA